MPWTDSLARTIKPSNHAALHTLADARAYVLELPGRVASHQAWQHAGQLMLLAAATPTRAAIEDATRQMELALFVTGLQDIPAGG